MDTMRLTETSLSRIGLQKREFSDLLGKIYTPSRSETDHCSSPLYLRACDIQNQIFLATGARGSVVVKALCYKPEGGGFDSR
jgi:hypothetical protein